MPSSSVIERIIAAAARIGVTLVILTHLGILLSLAGSKAPAELIAGMLRTFCSGS